MLLVITIITALLIAIYFIFKPPFMVKIVDAIKSFIRKVIWWVMSYTIVLIIGYVLGNQYPYKEMILHLIK